LYQVCQAGKQQRTSFPVKAKYRVRRRLELVHGDLCSPITQATPRGNKYMLLVDDLSRYMLVVMIPSKDHVVVAIKEIQARTKGKSGLKLRALRTDHGGVTPHYIPMVHNPL
jgi:hypothetical protein